MRKLSEATREKRRKYSKNYYSTHKDQWKDYGKDKGTSPLVKTRPLPSGRITEKQRAALMSLVLAGLDSNLKIMRETASKYIINRK